jgi:hypothetical protein
MNPTNFKQPNYLWVTGRLFDQNVDRQCFFQVILMRCDTLTKLVLSLSKGVSHLTTNLLILPILLDCCDKIVTTRGLTSCQLRALQIMVSIRPGSFC